MSYKYSEIKEGYNKLSDLTEQEQANIRKEWDRLCARETVNTSEHVFVQKSNGRFFEAIRGRIAANRYQGSKGGYWHVRFGDCCRWKFAKDPFGEYYPVATDKFFAAKRMETGEVISVPSSVHTKKEVLALAKELGFEI